MCPMASVHTSCTCPATAHAAHIRHAKRRCCRYRYLQQRPCHALCRECDSFACSVRRQPRFCPSACPARHQPRFCHEPARRDVSRGFVTSLPGETSAAVLSTSLPVEASATVLSSSLLSEALAAVLSIRLPGEMSAAVFALEPIKLGVSRGFCPRANPASRQPQLCSRTDPVSCQPRFLPTKNSASVPGPECAPITRPI